MNVTPTEYARGIAAMLDDARERGGGRSACCSRGLCCTHLAEDHPAGLGHISTIHLGHGHAVCPDTEGQELAAGMTVAAYVLGLRVLGLDPDAFLTGAL